MIVQRVIVMLLESLLWIAPSQATVRQGHPKVEVLTGEAVQLRARQLYYKDAIVRAFKEMEKRGFRPAFRQGVILLAKGLHKRVSLGNQTKEQQLEELTFLPWDDGDASTWEGVIYAQGSGGEVTCWAVIAEEYFEVLEGSCSPDDGGSFAAAQNRHEPTLVRTFQGATSFRLIRRTPGEYPMPIRPGNLTWLAAGRLRSWAACSAAGCATAAIGCAFSGPGYFKCLAGWCLGSMVGCAIGVLLLN